MIATEHRVTSGLLPFRHWILDGFFDAGIAAQIADAFTLIPDDVWYERRHRHSLKWVTKHVDELPGILADALDHLNNQSTRWWLTGLTRIDPVLPDPCYYGGGCHQSRPGSFLDLHADFTVHDQLNARRCLNLLIYLSPDYDPRWGGELELWDEPMRHCMKRISPLFNRAVLFETSGTSWHGHPDPMRGPETARRNSLALYYYTPWHLDDARLSTTVYRARPWERMERMRLWAGRHLRALGLR